jgi:hypothetical protein
MIENLDAASFRRELAGLTQPVIDVPDTAELKDLATNICFVLALCYNRDVLDPIKLWDRIGSALATASQEAGDGDMDLFLSRCLEHVKAEHTVAASPHVVTLLSCLTALSDGTRAALVEYIRKYQYAVLIHGRVRWQEYKTSNKGGGAL